MIRVLLSVLAFASVTSAQAADRVAVVLSDDFAAYNVLVSPFLDAMEGKKITIYNLYGRTGEIDTVIGRVEAQRADVVYAIGAKAAWTVKTRLPNMPLIYAGILEPLRYGIEGDQVSGVSTDVDPVVVLSEFKSFFPQATKIGVLQGPSTPAHRVQAMEQAAVELDIELVVKKVSTPKDVRRRLADLFDEGANALWLPPDRVALSTDAYRHVAEELRRRRLPMLVDTRPFAVAGGSFGVVPDPVAVGEQAAELVQQALDGAAPGVLKKQVPRRHHVIVNLKSLERSKIPIDTLALDFVDELIR